MPEAVLTVDGTIHAGWKSVQVSTSLRQLAGTFSLTFTDIWPGQQEKYGIKEGSRCQVTLGGEKVIDGWVDSLSPSYDQQSHSLSLQGRDLCADLVDCCHTGERVDFKGETVLTIATEMCKPFGIEVKAEAPVGAPLDKARYSQGDTIHDTLVKLCRMRGLLPVSFGDGKLVLTAAGKVTSGATLVQGRNIESANATFNSADRFKEYIVKGQNQAPPEFFHPPAEDEDDEERVKGITEAVSPVGRATDPAVTRHRSLVLLAETGGNLASMERRARFEATTRAGHSRSVNYTVQDWTSPGGGLWRVNRLVSIQDTLLGLDGEYLIESVTFNRSGSGGTTTELGIVHPDAYAEEPAPDQAGGVTTRWDGL